MLGIHDAHVLIEPGSYSAQATC